MMQPWSWWISGTLIGLIVPLLVVLGGKWFGISSSLQYIGKVCNSNSGLEYLRSYDEQSGRWLVFFVGGIILGAFVAVKWLSPAPIDLLPEHYHSIRGVAMLFLGGFLIGFGARYAGGCTSGHAITGISNLNPASFVATLCFFAGGLAVTWLTDWLVF